MSGPINQFVRFDQGTGGDTGENAPLSTLPIQQGQALNGGNNDATGPLNSSPENLRQRTEALRQAVRDTAYMRDADRGLILGGPGLVTWPGSTTAAHSGIPVISDNLYILPMLTPGAAQAAPIPPVASKFGTVTLQKTGPAAGIVLTSNRRSYDGGDQISVTVVSGTVFSAVLSDSPQRSIIITAPAGTTLTTVINAVNLLVPSGEVTALVTAALAPGAAGTDLLLIPQAKQFVAGNYDGEGHALTPAALAAFFVANPGSALAEGDTLCIQYADLVALATDPQPLGGRRQSIPENSNTAIPSGSFFNSRVNPEKLVNAIPVCKVVNGDLVFLNGQRIQTGGTTVPLGSGAVATTTTLGVVELHAASLTPTAPKVLSDGDLGAANGVPQLDANQAVTVTAKAGSNETAVTGVGDGTGAGVQGTGGATGAGVKGTGGTNGAGLLGQGTGTGAGADMTGGATGPAAISHGVLNNNLPQYVAKDSAGNARHVIDHNGLPMGLLGRIYEVWNAQSSVSASGQWITGTYFSSNYKNATIPNYAQQTATAAYPAAYYQVTPDGGAAGNYAYLTGVVATTCRADGTGLVYVMEWEAAITTPTVDMSTYMGWTSGNHDAATSYVRFRVSRTGGTLGNIVCETAAGAAPTQYSTSTPAMAQGSAPSQKFRLELHTAGSAYGLMARFFIDGNHITDIATTVPAIALAPQFGGFVPSGGGATTLSLGHLALVWNRFASPTAL